MAKKLPALVIVPHGRARTRQFRIRAPAIVALVVISVVGMAGYFIPFSRLTVDTVEQNQAKNLKEQNRKLFKRIHSMSGTVKVLERRVRKLQGQRDQIAEAAGVGPTIQRGAQLRRSLMDSLGLDGMVRHVERLYEFTLDLAARVGANHAYVTAVPVSRPVNDEAVVTARYGEMRDPFTGAIKWHYGTDYANERGAPVLAAGAGTVSKVETHRTWGMRVRVDHSYGFATVYAHLDEVKVRQGQRVGRGDPIGAVGASGLATGPHLHYEVWHENTPVDPEGYIFPEVPASPRLAQATPLR